MIIIWYNDGQTVTDSESSSKKLKLKNSTKNVPGMPKRDNSLLSSCDKDMNLSGIKRIDRKSNKQKGKNHKKKKYHYQNKLKLVELTLTLMIIVKK